MKIEKPISNQYTTSADSFWQPKGILRRSLPNMALRPSGRKELAGRKIIKCPHCTEILIDVDRYTLVQIFRIPKNKRKHRVSGIEYRKCYFCKNEVGMVMT